MTVCSCHHCPQHLERDAGPERLLAVLGGGAEPVTLVVKIEAMMKFVHAQWERGLRIHLAW
jgi:hypothetical protein